MKIDARVVLAIAAVLLITGGAFAFTFTTNIPYGGGGEIGTNLSVANVKGNGLESTWYPTGQHEWPNYEQYSDLDGNFEDHDWTWDGTIPRTYESTDGITESDIQLPGVIISVGYPYYLEDLGDQLYRQSEEAVVEREYEKTYTSDNISYVYHYELINYAFDVTLRTDADSYFKDVLDFGWLYAYGYYFEAKTVELSTLVNFGLSPWVPVGVWNGSYDAIGGWAGILQAQVYEADFGVFEDTALEEEMEKLEKEGVGVLTTGHIVDGMEITFDALNMYYPASGDVYQEIDFDTPDAIRNVTNAVNLELGVKLAAGAAYIADDWAKWTNIAVRNVFVTYRVVVKLATTVNLQLITEGDPVTRPAGGRGLGDPPPIPLWTAFTMAWNEFWTDVGEVFTSPIGILYVVIILVIIAGVVYFLIRSRMG